MTRSRAFERQGEQAESDGGPGRRKSDEPEVFFRRGLAFRLC